MSDISDSKIVNKHTPTPWDYDVTLSESTSKPLFNLKQKGIHYYMLGAVKSEEDAEFIIRAVNSHNDHQKTIQILRRMLEKATGWSASEISKEIAIAQAEKANVID